MNRRTKRRVIVLTSIVGLVVLLGVGGTVLRTINRERMASEALEEGLAAYERQEYEQALRRLGVYTRYDDQNAEVWFALGDSRRFVVQPNGRHLLAARAMLEQAVQMDPSNAQAYEILLDIHLQLGQWQELARTATSLLELDPDNLYAARLRVEANLQRGDDEQALEAAGKVVQIQQGAIDAHLEMISTMSRTGMPAREIRAYIEEQVAPAHEGSTGLAVLRAGIEFDSGQRDQAIQMLTDAGEGRPSDGIGARMLLEAIEQVAAATRDYQLYELSEQEWLSTWLEDPELAPYLYEVAAGRAWRQGDAQRAIDLSNRAASHTDQGGYTEAAFAWGILGAIELDRQSDVAQLRSAFEAAIEPSTRTRAQNWASAIEAFERFRAGEPRAEGEQASNLELARAARGSDGVVVFIDAMRLADRTSDREAVLRLRLLGEQPSWRRARLSEARVHMGGNRPTEAIQIIRRDPVLGQSRVGEMILADAVATIAERSGDGSMIDLSELDAALERSPENALLLATMGRAELVRGNTERALELGRRLAQAEAAEAAVASVRFAERLADVDASAALDIVDRIARTGEDPISVTIAATGMARLGRPEEARALVAERSAASPDSGDRAWTFARIQLANTIDDEQSRADLRTLSSEHPDDPRVQMEILDGEHVWDDEALVAEIVVRLREIQGDDATEWRIFEARRLLADEANTDAARNAAALFEPIFRNEMSRRDTDAMLLAADAFERIGDAESQVRALRFAADGDEPGRALPRLIEVLQNTGESERAAERLRQFVEMGDLSTRLLIARQQLLERQGLTELARRDLAALAARGEPAYVLQNAVLTRPRESTTPLTDAELAALEADLSPQAQLDAAELLARVGRYDDGLARLQGLPEQTELGSRAVFIARYMRDHGRLDDAVSMLEERGRSQSDADAWMEAARLLVGDGRLDEALALLSRAATAMPESEAMANFAGSLSGDLETNTFDRMARFTVAAGERSDASDGLRGLAAISQRYLSGELTIAQAAGEIEGFLAQNATLYPGWPMLIAAWQQQDNDAEAVRAARVAINALPNDHRVARDATQLLVGLEQYDEAAGLAATWRTLSPDDESKAQAETVLGFCEHARGNFQRAASLLESHVDRLLSDPAANAQAIQALAESLVVTDRMARAEEVLEDLARNETAWAGFMASIASAGPASESNIERTERWLQMVDEQLSTDQLGAAYLVSGWMALYGRSASADHASQALRVAQAAMDADVDSWELQAAKATAHEALGEYQAAVDAYERSLELAGTPIPALLNNAAWVCTTELGQHEKAIGLAQQAVETARTIGDAPAARAAFLHTLGVAQLSAGRATEALASFDEGLAVVETTSLQLGRIESLLADEQRDQAVAEFRRLRPDERWSPLNRERHQRLQSVLGSG